MNLQLLYFLEKDHCRLNDRLFVTVLRLVLLLFPLSRLGSLSCVGVANVSSNHPQHWSYLHTRCNFNTIQEEDEMPALEMCSTSCPPPFIDCLTDLGVHAWLVFCHSESKHCGRSGSGGSARPGRVMSASAGQEYPVQSNQGGQAHWLSLQVTRIAKLSCCWRTRKSPWELQTVKIKISLPLSYMECMGRGD